MKRTIVDWVLFNGIFGRNEEACHSQIITCGCSHQYRDQRIRGQHMQVFFLKCNVAVCT